MSVETNLFSALGFQIYHEKSGNNVLDVCQQSDIMLKWRDVYSMSLAHKLTPILAWN